MLRRHFLLLGAIGLVALIIGLLWLWQPVRQVRRHHEKLLGAVEGKNWKQLSTLMADDYSDRWGHDKATVLERSRQVFSQFFVIGIETRDVEFEEANGEGTVSTRLSLTGSGGPLAQLAMERVATLQQPFVFKWRQQSWKPWDWALVRVDQPELEVPEL